MNSTIKLGLIYAVVSLATVFLMITIFGNGYMFKLNANLISFGILAIAIIILGRKLLRDPEEDRLSYGQAVKSIFIAFLISSAISSVILILAFSGNEQMKVELEKGEKEMQEGMLRWMGGLMGQSEAEQEAALEQAKESGEIKTSGFPYTWAKLPANFGTGAIFSLLWSLLVALFIREKETEFA